MAAVPIAGALAGSNDRRGTLKMFNEAKQLVTPEYSGVPITAVVAGIVPVIIGFAGTVALVIRAEQTMGATPAQAGGAVSALCLGIGVTSLLLSWRWRMPIVLAWSTPGAALLAAAGGNLPFSVAVGAFIAASALMIVVALLPGLTDLAAKIPVPVSSGMLAGILLPFCLTLFRSVPSDPVLAIAPLICFLGLRAKVPRHALSAALALAIAIILARGQMPRASLDAGLPHLTPAAPSFGWQPLASIAVPLFLVTLVSQNLPGLLVMRSAGYDPPPRRALFATGLATLATAPFGGFGVNLAAIIAALCTGADAHPDRERRWMVGIVYGATWIALGISAGLAVSLLTALPSNVVAVVTGIALLGPLFAAVKAMNADTAQFEAGIVTFVATASGFALFGIGSAFWGLIAGGLVIVGRRPAAAPDHHSSSLQVRAPLQRQPTPRRAGDGRTDFIARSKM